MNSLTFKGRSLKFNWATLDHSARKHPKYILNLILCDILISDLSAILNGPHKCIALFYLQTQLKVTQQLVKVWVICFFVGFLLCVFLRLESH